MKLNHAVDDRGWFTELFKGDWGQVTLVQVNAGCCRGFHRHPKTNEVWYVIQGNAAIITHDEVHVPILDTGTVQFPRFDIRAGVSHGIVNIGTEPAWLLYFADRAYDPDDPDTESW